MLIFVYGTLRRGGGLNFKLTDIAEYKGTYRTTPSYTMYDMGCPCLSKGGTTSIVGDVFKVEDLGQIAHIHNMEVRAGYTLEKVELLNFEEDVFAYFQKPEWDAPIISSGDWVLHRNSYVEDSYRARR